MSNLGKTTLERLIETNEKINVIENEIERSGIYNVESKNIHITLQYPTKFGFFTHTTMALVFNGEKRLIVTYSFKEKEEVEYFLDMIEPSDRSENYFYTNVKDGIQIIPQRNLRLFLSKDEILELYVVLTKVHSKIEELKLILK